MLLIVVATPRRRLYHACQSSFLAAPPRGECHFTLALRNHFTSITL